jgi:DNA-binding transcriptional ArsR family regulator
MGMTKTDIYEEEEVEIATLAKALGHPARIAILKYLVKQEACINSDLVEELGLAQSTVSQHLKELKNAGLIQGTVSGVSMSYCVNREQWEKAKTLILDLFDKEIDKWNNQCC